jgi:hypothetical protein
MTSDLEELELELEQSALTVVRQRLLIMRQAETGLSQVEAEQVLEQLLLTHTLLEKQYRELLQELRRNQSD